MKNILMMKNTVKWYIRILLFQFSIGMLLGLIILFSDKRSSSELFVITIIFLLISLVIILFIRFIYKLIYGRFIHKLEKNYKELSQIEEIP